ncbi:MAG TPA: glycosyltransferase family 1 protein [Planctomycetota bacterium]|nr:glycosyltransferase family 1 protein [Planctomycetota bacterium]
MRTVVFDGACLGDGPITGVGRAFVNALGAYADNFDSRCVLLLPRDARKPPLMKVEFTAAPRGALRRQLVLPRLLRELRADVLHSSVAAVPLRAPCPTVATVHDLPWLHPELQERTTLWRRLVTRRALRSAAAIVAPSAFTARDVATLLGAGGPVHVIAHGTQLGQQPRPDATALRSGPLLVLGDDRPRKNRERVRQAHAIARQRCRHLPELRFVGPPDDYVDEAAKLQLLGSCRAVVQCSLFEGFGMPVLEALANGAPVLCSDIAPFREITQDGDSALLVDPQSVDAIAGGMVRIHEDEPLRERLARSGWHRASQFQRIDVAGQWHRLHRGLVETWRRAGVLPARP